jgi:hypothetical protein
MPVAKTSTGKSSAATPGKVVSAVKAAADVSLRTAKPAATRSTMKASAPHTAVEACAPHTASVHSATTTVATTTAASHCGRGQRNNESECCRSDHFDIFDISHRILSFAAESKISRSAGEPLAACIVPKVPSH